MAGGATDGNLSMPEYMYETYKNAGPVPGIFCAALYDFIMMLLGYIGNGLVIFATLKNKSLHGSCNYFLCLGCLGDIFHQTAHWIYLYVSITGINFIPFSTCLYFNTIPQTGVTLSILGTFYVGIDRLIGVLFPTRYRSIPTLPYVSAFYAIAVLVSCYFLYVSYSFIGTGGKHAMVTCILIDSLGGEALPQFFQLCVIINILDIVIYTTVWILLRTRSGNNEVMKKVFRSLQVIMFTVAFGWLITAAINGLVIPFLKVPVSQQYFVSAYSGWLPNTASSANFVILYFFSQEYRSTFQQILSPICPCMRNAKKNSVFSASKSPIIVSAASQSAHF
ncbi:CRE-SRSX-29 protein [Aphelenchoides bicaudatus]|nr:CRE-SRSX-29 protein [Aphelenchoides bicaudatus]